MLVHTHPTLRCLAFHCTLVHILPTSASLDTNVAARCKRHSYSRCKIRNCIPICTVTLPPYKSTCWQAAVSTLQLPTKSNLHTFTYAHSISHTSSHTSMHTHTHSHTCTALQWHTFGLQSSPRSAHHFTHTLNFMHPYKCTHTPVLPCGGTLLAGRVAPEAPCHKDGLSCCCCCLLPGPAAAAELARLSACM